MATTLGLYNAALATLGERKLASVTENREPRRVLDDVYDGVVAECLEAGQWHFAMRTEEIDSDSGVTPTGGFAYAFNKPSDWVRTAAISASDVFDPPLIRFSDETDYWMADVDPLHVRYVSNGATYGGDLTRWPASFTRFVEVSLAERICERLTQNGSKHQEISERMLPRARRNALAKDAMNGPTPKFFPTGSWVQSRGADMRRRYDRG